jgi:hypothetical protein
MVRAGSDKLRVSRTNYGGYPQAYSGLQSQTGGICPTMWFQSELARPARGIESEIHRLLWQVRVARKRCPHSNQVGSGRSRLANAAVNLRRLVEPSTVDPHGVL